MNSNLYTNWLFWSVNCGLWLWIQRLCVGTGQSVDIEYLVRDSDVITTSHFVKRYIGVFLGVYLFVQKVRSIVSCLRSKLVCGFLISKVTTHNILFTVLPFQHRIWVHLMTVFITSRLDHCFLALSRWPWQVIGLVVSSDLGVCGLSSVCLLLLPHQQLIPLFSPVISDRRKSTLCLGTDG